MTALSAGYKILTSVAAPLLFPAFCFSERGRRRLRERYGHWDPVPGNPFWFHGSSVGEVRGILPILEEIRRRIGPVDALLSATSPTALDVEARVQAKRISPLDSPWAVSRALKSVSPRCFVFGETELWPVLLEYVLRSDVPVHLVNGRISDYTFSRYKLVRGMFAPLLHQFSSLSVVDQHSAERFIALGARSESVKVAGNTKYDTTPSLAVGDRRRLRDELFPGLHEATPIVVLGSVRPGEEKFWLRAVSNLRSRNIPIALVVAPRHAEKYDYFAQALQAAGLPFRRWSRSSSDAMEPIVLLDTMGLLGKVYSLATLAFIGATLVDVGGHNPLEAAQYGVPVAVGPHVSVIREVVASMDAVNGVVKVSDQKDVEAVMDRVARNDDNLRLLGERGEAVWRGHTGATSTIVDTILAASIADTSRAKGEMQQ